MPRTDPLTNPPMRRRTAARRAALAATLALALGGCASLPPAQAYRDSIAHAQRASGELGRVIADAEQEASALPAGAQRDAALTIAKRAADQKLRVDRVLSGLRDRLGEAGDNADAVDAAAAALRGLGGAVPAPFGVYLAMGGSLLLAANRWVKSIRTRRAASSILSAIEQEKSPSGAVDFSDAATKTSLRSRMSADARALVERARARTPQAHPTASAGPR